FSRCATSPVSGFGGSLNTARERSRRRSAERVQEAKTPAEGVWPRCGGGEAMRRRLAVASITAVLVLNVGTVGRAASMQTRVGITHPTWWAKYLVVSSPSLRSSIRTSVASVNVGTNVDVSNEEGPQSETSIAIDPSDPSRIVAVSN